MNQLLPPSTREDIKKSQWRERVNELHPRLLKLQRQLSQADFPVILVFAGVDGAGKHETVNLLSEWLDPRYLLNLAYQAPNDYERARPRMWRYWRDLPVRGQIATVLSGWYSLPLLDKVKGRISEQQFQRRIEENNRFERMLSDDGALILKFWMHLSDEQQRARLKRLIDDPLAAWNAQARDWEHLHLYDRFVDTAQAMIRQSHSDSSGWTVVDGGQSRLRHLLVAEQLADELDSRLKITRSVSHSVAIQNSREKRLDKLDLSATLDKDDYQQRLGEAQARLAALARLQLQTGRSTVLVFEGWDAAGKGGAIRRLVRPLDARWYRILPIAAPNDEERARHYLWRFWRQLPEPGHWRIFDRSWYGRLLVERVEGFASEAEWTRAYDEINEFEAELVESGTQVLKFWLHISEEEQLKRFKARETNPLKSWKLTDEDWRNRHKWSQYQQAVEDMLKHTDNSSAPWTLIAGNDKKYARVQVIESLCQHLEAGL